MTEENNISEKELQNISQQLEAQDKVKNILNNIANKGESPNTTQLKALAKTIVETHPNKTIDELVKEYRTQVLETCNTDRNVLRNLLEDAKNNLPSEIKYVLENKYYPNIDVEVKKSTNKPLIIYTCPACGESHKPMSMEQEGDHFQYYQPLCPRHDKADDTERCSKKTNRCDVTKIIYPYNQEAATILQQPNILERIHEHLEKSHIQDHKQKIGLYISALTGLLSEPKKSVSVALKGNSSAGKDNLSKTVLNLFPNEHTKWLTQTTPPALRDGVKYRRVTAFSEINKHREGGANEGNTEKVKQLAEGGIHDELKDRATGFQTNKRVDTEQKALIYGTTEEQSDHELSTRFLVMPVRGTPAKNAKVLHHKSKSRSQIKKILNPERPKKTAQNLIRHLKADAKIEQPWAEALTDPDKEPIFDLHKERVKRDYERLLNLAEAITLLFQYQRDKVTVEGHEIIISHPIDFKIALQLYGDFFQLTYTGLDHRTQTFYEELHSLEGQQQEWLIKHVGEPPNSNLLEYDWIRINSLTEYTQFPNSKNTIHKRLGWGSKYMNLENTLSDLGLVEFKQVELQTGGRTNLVRTKKAGVKPGVNRGSTAYTKVPLTRVDTRLTGVYQAKITQWKQRFKYEKRFREPILPEKVFSQGSKANIKSEIDTRNLDTRQTSETNNESNSKKPLEQPETENVQTFEEYLKDSTEAGETYTVPDLATKSGYTKEHIQKYLRQSHMFSAINRKQETTRLN